MKNTLFPIFLKTDTLSFLIIGGGRVGLEKLKTLLRQNPKVSITLIATQIAPDTLTFLQQNPHLRYLERPYEITDLDNHDLLIIAIDNTSTTQQIIAQAHSRGILVNAADQPDLCDFYLGAIVQKGNLKIAISTNGKSPILAKRMREYLYRELPNNIDESLENLYQYRKNHRGNLRKKLNDLNRITHYLVNPQKIYWRNTYYVLMAILLIIFGYIIAQIFPLSDTFFLKKYN